jgi:hypothetical protein
MHSNNGKVFLFCAAGAVPGAVASGVNRIGPHPENRSPLNRIREMPGRTRPVIPAA